MTIFVPAVEEAVAMARDIAERHKAMRAEGTGVQKTLDALKEIAGGMRTLIVPAREDDDEIIDEACQRGFSGLRWATDEVLLKEARRRGLSVVELDMSRRDFEKEARKRNYRRSLSEFPKNEIQTYLRLQQRVQ